MTKKRKPICLSELIFWVKNELLAEEALKKDPIPLFAIEEVTVEVNFVVSGNLKGGFNLQVVEADAEIEEQRVQKATVKMTPLLDREQVIEELVETRPEIIEIVKSKSVKAVLKGRSADEGVIRSPR